jgi:hypothetical protein
MLLINKVNGLHAGQRWTVPLLNPVNFQHLSVPFLEAEVAAATLTWEGEEVPCYRIDYREPDQRPMARTWVRRRDGRVLEQDIEHLGNQISVVRDKQP